MEELIKRKTILKYRKEIDDIVKDIRRWMTERECVPSTEEIQDKCEAMFFASRLSMISEISEMKLIISAVFDRVSGRYGLLQRLLSDPAVNEIMVNGPDMIFIEKNRERMQVDDTFTSAAELEEIIRMFAADVHREINEASPIVDARLPSG